MTKKYNKGRFTNEEVQLIEDSINSKSYTEIAALINRDPYSVKKYIESKGYKTNLGPGKKIQVDHEITKKDFWPLLEKQLNPAELEVFVYHWDKICKQFGGDILPTEEIQVIDLIKTEIMVNRVLVNQKENDDMIKRLTAQLEDETDKDEVSNLEKQLLQCSTGTGHLTKQFLDLQTQKNKLLTDLRATRSERIKKIDASKESFIHWITELATDDILRNKIGLYIEKFRLAMEEEERRLMKYHKFEDGKIDQCIFNDKAIDYIEETTQDEE